MAGPFVIGVALALCAPPLGGIASAQMVVQRTVLTIHAGAEDFPANPLLDAGIRGALASRADVPIDAFSEYLEEDLFSGTEATLAFKDYIHRKYRDRHIDVVIAFTERALHFALDHRSELFPDAPIVFGAVSAPDEAVRRTGAGVTGITVAVAHTETLKLILELQPSTERVFIVANGENRRAVDAVRSEFREVSGRIRLTFIEEPTLPALLAAVKAVPPRSVILYIWQTFREPGHIVYPVEVAGLVAQTAAVPVYGTSDLHVGLGVVGGVVRGTRETGVRLGELALRILSGTRPQDIPVAVSQLRPIIDWRQMQRWGIESSRLPPQTDVRFRVPTPWDTYRRYVVGTIIVVSAQLVLIAALFTERINRRRAEKTVLAREATLRQSYDRIGQLNARMIGAQESARAEIARELHDDVCQELVGISLALTDLRRSSDGLLGTDARNTLSHVLGSTNDLADSIRRLSHEIHPATLRLVGLPAALQAHCVEVERRYDVQVAFDVDGDPGPILPEVALCVFRITQEALRNAAVHGDARRIAVSLGRSADRVVLTIADDGKGFDVNAARCAGHGLGLVSMEERTHVLGGTIEIVSRSRVGTTIEVQVPSNTQMNRTQQASSAPSDGVVRTLVTDDAR